MAFVEYSDTVIAKSKPMIRTIIRQFRENDVVNAERPIRMSFSVVGTTSSSYVNVYSMKVYVPKTAIYFRAVAQLSVQTDGTCYGKWNINDATYSDEQTEAGISYVDKTWTFTNVSAYQGQVITLNLELKRVGGTGGNARAQAPVNYRSYFSRS